MALVYSSTIQYAKVINKSTKLVHIDMKFIQQVTRIFLYYTRADDTTLLVALSAMASDQSATTAKTIAKTLKFLDCVAPHPDSILTEVRARWY